MKVSDVYGEGWQDPGEPEICHLCKGKIHSLFKDGKAPAVDLSGNPMHASTDHCIRHLRRENERLAVTVRKLERALVKHGALPKEARVATANKSQEERENADRR